MALSLPMEPQQIFSFLCLAFVPIFYIYSPASKSGKLWTTLYFSLASLYACYPTGIQAAFGAIKEYFYEHPIKTTAITLVFAVPLKYVQRKARFARLNAIKLKYGFTDDPKTYEDMSVEVAQEVERNMAEWEFPRLWQFGWISDFFRTSTDPGVSRAIGNSGHFINEDKRVEHQRMQATVHLMTGLAAYPVKSRNSSLVIARINEHHHRYGIKINSDDVLYLIIHFGLAPVPWINKFGYRKLEPFEVQAIWTLWRELGCRMGLKYIPKTLTQAQEWRKNFEHTMRWREEANEIMATAMLDQVLYPAPGPFKFLVAHVFSSIIDYEIVYYCRLEKYHPSAITREIVHDLFRFAGWFIRELSWPRLNRYQRSPDKPNKDGKMTFPHTPYDTMPWWQADFIWNRWGPRALFYRMVLGCPPPSPEFESGGVPFEAMGAPHPHPKTQASTEQKVRDNAAILEQAPLGYRPAIGWQANRLIPPVEGDEYGSEINRFPEGTPTTPNNSIRFTREYERRGAGYSTLVETEKPEDALQQVNLEEVEQQKKKAAAYSAPKIPNVSYAFQAAPVVSATA